MNNAGFENKMSVHVRIPMIASVLFCGLAIQLYGGNSSGQENNGWAGSAFYRKVFIENAGQCSEKLTNGKKIFYSTNALTGETYFTASGVEYCRLQPTAPDEPGEENDSEGADEIYEHLKNKMIRLGMEWVNSNPQVSIKAYDKQSYYYTFPDQNYTTTFRAESYKKIIYENLYPHIDVEYFLPEMGGLKYNLLIHPGADLTQVKLKYAGCKSMLLNVDGDLVIESEFGQLTEHTPVAFYSDGTSLACSFTKNNRNEIGFAAEITPGRDLVIDPWVSSPTFTVYNKAYDVNYDLAGNVYAFGAYNPFQLAKFNSAGALQWVYQCTSFYYVQWVLYGDMAVSPGGSTYLAEGYDLANGTRLFKIDASGKLATSTTGNPSMNEMWRMDFDFCSNKLLGIGGGTKGSYHAAIIDTTLQSFNPINIYNTALSDIDLTLLAIDPYTPFAYVASNQCPLSPSFYNNTVEKCPVSTMVPFSFSVPDGHNFIEIQSMSYIGPGLIPIFHLGQWYYFSGTNGYNGITVSPCFLYTYDGQKIFKRDKNSGSQVATKTISSKAFAWGGIAVDVMDNLYVGNNKQVISFDNGFNQTSAYNFPDTIYDVKLGPGNKLYVAGRGFVSVIDVMGTASITVTQMPSTGCTCDGKATVSNCASVSFNYLWTPSGQTTPSATGLCSGTNYTVSLTSKTGCVPMAFTGTVTIPAASGGFLVNTNVTNNSCSGSQSGSASVSATGGTSPFTFLWSTGQTTSSISNLAAGSYSVSVTDAAGCTISGNVVITQSPAMSASHSTTLTTCGPSAASAMANGGTAPYTYNWSNGSSTPVVTGLASGIYTITITDAAGCSATDTINVNSAGSKPSAQFIYNNPCLNNPTLFTDNSVGSVNQWQWNFGDGTPVSSQQNPSHTYLSFGTYTVTLIVSSGIGCNDTITHVVTISPAPVPAFIGDTVCLGELTTFNDLSFISSGTISSWLWNFGDGKTSTQQNPTHQYQAAGTYSVTLTVTSASGCGSTTISIVKIESQPTADFCLSSVQQPFSDPEFSFCDLWSKDVVQWSWNFGDGSSLDFTSTDPVHSYSAQISGNDYYHFDICLNVQNQFGCHDSICKVVELVPEFTFYIPNCFTPNGDFTNEMFFGKGRGIKEYRIMLFDRWGNLIWDCSREESNVAWDNKGADGLPSACKWNGKVEGGHYPLKRDGVELAQEDVYVWKVELKDIFDRYHEYVGHVSIVK